LFNFFCCIFIVNVDVNVNQIFCISLISVCCIYLLLPYINLYSPKNVDCVCLSVFVFFFVYAAIEIFSMNKVEYKNGSNTKTRIRWWNKAVCIIVGRFQLLARWPGTHSRILSGIQRAAQTILCVYLKRICSRVTNASSALGVLNDYALYKSKHSLTHSLIIYVYRGVRDPPEFGQNRLDVCG